MNINCQPLLRYDLFTSTRILIYPEYPIMHCGIDFSEMASLSVNKSITGDLNGRTGELDETFREDGNMTEQFIPIPNTFANLPKRRNCDDTLISHRERIIQLCHTFDLDASGNFTHLNANKGESTIDYIICNETLYKCIENLMVLPLNEISDHSKIVTIFKSRIKAQNPEKDKYKWNSLKTWFKWNAKNKNKFISVLQNSDEAINDILVSLRAQVNKLKNCL